MGYFVADTGISTGNVIIGTTGLSVYSNILTANVSNVSVGTDLRVSGNIYAGNLLTAAGTAFIGTQERILYQPGALIATVGKARWYPPTTVTVNQVKATLVAACVGRPANININKNGTAVTSVSIPANSTAFAYSNVSITLQPTDYLTVDVIQAGNTSPGSDLHVIFYY